MSRAGGRRSVDVSTMNVSRSTGRLAMRYAEIPARHADQRRLQSGKLGPNRIEAFQWDDMGVELARQRYDRIDLAFTNQGDVHR